MRVDAHGVPQSFSYVDVAVFVVGVRPGPDFPVQDLVRQVGFEFEFVADIIVQGSGVGTEDGVHAGIGFPDFPGSIPVHAQEAAVKPADRAAFIPQELLAEAEDDRAQVGLLDIFLAQTGITVPISRRSRSAGVC